MQELQTEIETFINSRNKNQWLDGDNVQLYLRKSVRAFQGELIQCLDLASISVDEKFQRKGLSKKILNILLAINPYKSLFIENVHNPFLYNYLEKRNDVEYDEQHINCVFIHNKRIT